MTLIPDVITYTLVFGTHIDIQHGNLQWVIACASSTDDQENIDEHCNPSSPPSVSPKREPFMKFPFNMLTMIHNEETICTRSFVLQSNGAEEAWRRTTRDSLLLYNNLSDEQNPRGKAERKKVATRRWGGRFSQQSLLRKQFGIILWRINKFA